MAKGTGNGGRSQTGGRGAAGSSGIVNKPAGFRIPGTNVYQTIAQQVRAVVRQETRSSELRRRGFDESGAPLD